MRRSALLYTYLHVDSSCVLWYDLLFVEMFCCVFFFQAEDGIRDLVRSRGLGDVYKRQVRLLGARARAPTRGALDRAVDRLSGQPAGPPREGCLLYTSDAADERSSVDLGGRRIIKKKTSTSADMRYPSTQYKPHQFTTQRTQKTMQRKEDKN